MKKASTFIFRSPRLTDLNTLHDIEQKSFTTDHISLRRMRHWIQAENRAFLVCESKSAGQSQVAGYILFFYRCNTATARLYSIAVSENFRGFGIARQLMDRGEKQVRKDGKTRIQLEVKTDNRPAIGLYEALGYSQFGLYKEFYEDGSDALRMAKEL